MTHAKTFLDHGIQIRMSIAVDFGHRYVALCRILCPNLGCQTLQHVLVFRLDKMTEHSYHRRGTRLSAANDEEGERGQDFVS